MAYSSKVIEHYENPKNVGSLDKNDPRVGTGLVGAPACGDVLKLQIQVNDKGVIEDAKFKTYGCLVSNTMLNTPEGLEAIDKLRPMSSIVAWDGIHLKNHSVERIIRHVVDIEDLLLVILEVPVSMDGIMNHKKLIVTKSHIFYTAENMPIEAEDLAEGSELLDLGSCIYHTDGDKVLTANSIEVLSVEPVTFKDLEGSERVDGQVVVYDLELSPGAHVYFADSVGMHNCGSAIASSSLVSEWIKGKTLDEAANIKNQAIAEELALPPVKIHCSILAEDSIKAAIADYRSKHE